MTYKIIFSHSARKELEALESKLVRRIIPKIEALIPNPRPSGCTKLQGYRNLWRIRIGDYRVVYAVDDNKQTIDIMRIAHRREVYD